MRSRTPKRLSAIAATAAITFSGLAALAGPASADPIPRLPDYYPSGPQTDVPVSTVTGGGWTRCYLDTYQTHLVNKLPDLLSACSGKYLMLAGRSTGSSTLSLLAAAPREDVLFDTGDFDESTGTYDTTTTHRANGSEWYFGTRWSWGFAPAGQTVEKSSCDVQAGPLRLCWHTSDDGGYRIGDTTDLNGSTEYERVVYQSDGLPSQTITFASTSPTMAYVGRTYAATATSDSGKDVALTSSTPDVCSVVDGTYSFLKAGTCTVAADQAGDGDYAAAPQVTQSISVQQVPTTVAVFPDDTVVSGQQTSLFATVKLPQGVTGDLPAGAVQFSVDGVDLGAPVAVDTTTLPSSGGRASSPAFSPRAGSHPVTATFVPTDDTTYAGNNVAGTLTVAKAATEVKVAVTAQQLVATVSSPVPGATAPTGTVLFRVAGEEVGRADVVNGKAVLDHAVAPGQSNAVSAEYLGDDETVVSSDSVTRNDPSLSAETSSTTPRSAAGWWRSPVRISYTCAPNGAELVGDCPADDVLGSEGAGQSVTRSISAVDGGIGSVTTTVDIDRTAPKVALKGVKAGQRYFAKAPATRCVASDALSGLASCKVTTTAGRNGARTVTATATDQAGNVATAKASYLVVRQAIVGSTYRNGAWEVRKGHGYTVQSVNSSRPTYRIASATPGALAKAATRSTTRTGKSTWAIGATMNMPRTADHTWYLGIQQGRTITPIKVRLIG